jgi:hypothetical protein
MTAWWLGCRAKKQTSVTLSEEYFDEGEKQRVEEWLESGGASQTKWLVSQAFPGEDLESFGRSSPILRLSRFESVQGICLLPLFHDSNIPPFLRGRCIWQA